MEQNTKKISDYIAIAKRYKRRMLMTFVGLIMLSVAIAVGLPPVYRSTATILIEQQEIPADLVRTTITSYADQRIQVISQRVMTRTNLQKILKKYNLHADDQKDEPIEVIIEEIREEIKMNTVSADVVDPRSGRPTQATIAFTVSYDSDSAEIAQKVANELVSLYLNENLKSRTESVTQTSRFLQDETEKLRFQIAESDRKLADFKKINVGQLPEFSQLNLSMIDRSERDIAVIYSDLRAAKERKIYIESQLAGTSLYNTSFGQSGERIFGAADRLKQLNAEYTRKVAIYSDDHPDIVRMRKEIKALEAVQDIGDEVGVPQKIKTLQAEVKATRSEYSADHPDVKRLEKELASLVQENSGQQQEITSLQLTEKPDNPAYIQLQTQLETTNLELETLERKQKGLEVKLSDYENRMAQSPQVEREFSELTRDQENAWIRYRELMAKQMEAQLAEVMESERQGERFTLIDPPLAPEEPLKPNRLAILFLGVIISIGGGIGAALLSDLSDKTIRGVNAIATLVNVPVIMGIPYIETKQESNTKKLRQGYFVGSILLATISSLVTIHYFLRPLDVLWYIVARKFGI